MSVSLPWPRANGIVLFFFTTNMVDDVLDSMERMKLTSKEEEIIAISDEEWLEAIESCNLSLIGKS